MESGWAFHDSGMVRVVGNDVVAEDGEVERNSVEIREEQSMKKGTQTEKCSTRSWRYCKRRTRSLVNSILARCYCFRE